MVRHPLRVLRLCCALLLAGAGAPALAAWTYVGDVAEGVVYYDEATPKKAGAVASVMIMVNFKQEDPPKAAPAPKPGAAPAGKPPASAVYLVEIDCADPRMREMNAEGFTQQNGKGTSMQKSAAPGPWKKIAAPVFAKPEALLKIQGFACGTAKP